jgi:predicted Zn-dependent protease
VTVTPLPTTADPIDLLTEAIASLDLPADWVGIRATREESVSRSQRDGKPEANRRSLQQGAMVEVLVNGQMGYAATNRLTVAGLRKPPNSPASKPKPLPPGASIAFSPEIRPKVLGVYQTFAEKPLKTLTTAHAHELLSRICQGLKVSDQIVQASASISAKEIDTWLVSTSGTQVHQKFSFFTPSFSATAQEGAIVQTRTNNGRGHAYQAGWEFLAIGDELWASVQRIGEQAVELLTAPECPDMTTTLVLAPDQMMLQIHESIGHPLELDRILGDERNYAGGSFVKPEDFGQLQYGSDQLNVTFDPTVEQEFASYAFDDTGAVAERQYLIRMGCCSGDWAARKSGAAGGARCGLCPRH